MSVYLDDLPSTRSEDTSIKDTSSIPKIIADKEKKDGTDTKHDGSENDTSKDGKSLKRQLSIADMFSKVPRDNVKRLKTDTESSSTMRRVVSLGGVPSLNSIPLNLDAFRASLTPEESTLLKLEMETMGKSWSVQNPYF